MKENKEDNKSKKSNLWIGIFGSIFVSGCVLIVGVLIVLGFTFILPAWSIELIIVLLFLICVLNSVRCFLKMRNEKTLNEILYKAEVTLMVSCVAIATIFFVVFLTKTPSKISGWDIFLVGTMMLFWVYGILIVGLILKGRKRK